MTNETMNKRMIVPLAIAAVLLCLLLGFCVRKCNSSNMSGNTQTQSAQTSQGTDATSLGEVTPIDTTGGASGSKSDKDKNGTSDKNKDKSKDGTSGSSGSSNKNKNKSGTSSSGGSGTSSSGSGGSSGRSSGGSSSRGSGGSSSNGGGSNGSSNNGSGNNNSSDNPTPTPTPHTHTPVTDDAVYATCQHVGLTEGSHCSTCGEVLQVQEEVPIRNHVYLDGECIWCGKPAPFGEGLIDELELPEDDFN